jgi:hypothetical protein
VRDRRDLDGAAERGVRDNLLMAELTAETTDQATSKQIHDLGSTFMLHKETMARSTDNGYESPFTFISPVAVGAR